MYHNNQFFHNDIHDVTVEIKKKIIIARASRYLQISEPINPIPLIL